ncbi:MAG TPA: PH domain-containing protein [Rugosimonospora sp.]
MSTVKFRHNVAIAIAGLVALFGAVPVAATRWYLAPILLVPLAVMIWGWRAGTDANRNGLSIRALFGARRVPWAEITGFVPSDRRVIATLNGGRSVILPGVAPADLPRLIAASGHGLGEASGEDLGDASDQGLGDATPAEGRPEAQEPADRDDAAKPA